MAQRRSSIRPARPLPSTSTPRTSPTVWVVGGLAVLAAIGAAVALSGSSAASPSPSPPPPPNPNAGAGQPCAASNQPPQLYTFRLADSGSTKTVTSVDVVHTALLIQEPQVASYDWVVTSSDSTILAKFQSTTGPDPSSAHGTDRLDYWRPMGSGTVTLSGQLLPKSGSGPSIGSFSLTVVVTCAGGAGATQNARTLLAGKSYTIAITRAAPFTAPSRAAIASSLAAALATAANRNLTVTPIQLTASNQPTGSSVLLYVTMNTTTVVPDSVLASAVGASAPYTIVVS